MKKKLFDDQLIVITGAAGFIGSAVVRYLNDKGFANLLLVDDIRETDKWKNLIGKRCVDFISRYDLFDWLPGREQEIEAFIHLGACSDTTERDGDYMMENNYRYSVKLAEYALEHGHRFIYASSAATYGDGKLGFSDDHAILDTLSPMNLYGYSKHIFDLWVKEHGALDQVVGLKYFNIFGPNEYHKGRMASMVMHMRKQILEKGEVGLFKSSEPDRFGDGEQMRDFYYVKDAAKLTCSFLENDVCGIFNAGSGEPHTWNALANAVFAAMERPARIKYIPMPEDLVPHYQNYTCGDMTKLASAMPIKNDFVFEEAVKDYVTNYLDGSRYW